MFELKDLPSRDTLEKFGKHYGNPDVNSLHTWLAWASATDEMLTAFEANLATHGLSQTPFFVLLLLKRNPEGLTIGALASGVAVASQTMTRAIHKMEASGWCSKHPDPEDGRISLVRLTTQGDAMLSHALPKHYEWVAKLMSDFTADELTQLTTIMRKVSSTLKRMKLATNA